jgi:hypothetical protein
MKCQCKLCLRDREWKIRLQCVPKESQEYFENIYEHLLNVETDLNYYESIEEGSWPSSIETLERWLENVKAKQKEN